MIKFKKVELPRRPYKSFDEFVNIQRRFYGEASVHVYRAHYKKIMEIWMKDYQEKKKEIEVQKNIYTKLNNHLTKDELKYIQCDKDGI